MPIALQFSRRLAIDASRGSSRVGMVTLLKLKRSALELPKSTKEKHSLGQIHDLESFCARDCDLGLQEQEVIRLRRKEEVLRSGVLVSSARYVSGQRTR